MSNRPPLNWIVGFVICLELASCGDSAAPSPDPNTTPTEPISTSSGETTPPPTPAVQYSQQHLMLCQARKLPVGIPPGPPPQYFLKGKVSFIPSDPNAATLVQGLSIAIGGPDRMKTELHANNKSQVFFLTNSNEAWLRRPEKPATDVEKYDPTDLANDNALRWLVLQFPWPLQDQLQIEEQSEKGFPIKLLFQEPGENAPAWKLELNSDGRLRSISEIEEGGDTLRLEVSDWVPGTSGWLYPKNWNWHFPWGQMEEHFESVSDQASFLDSWFHPSQATQRGMNFLTEITGHVSPIRLADQLTVVEQPLVGLKPEDWAKLSDPPPAKKWQVYEQDGKSLIVFTPMDPNVKLPKTLATYSMPEDQLWLRWRSFYEQPPAKAAETLRNLAQRNGLEPTGSVWIGSPTIGSDRGSKLYLVPVARK